VYFTGLCARAIMSPLLGIYQSRFCLCRRCRLTVQQIQRYGLGSSCKSSTFLKLRLQVCRCYGKLLLETLTVQR